MATPILDIVELVSSQAQKEVTINEALVDLEGAANDTVDIGVTGADPADVSVTAAQFTRHYRFRLTPTGTAPVASAGRFFHLDIPATKRAFVVTNDTAVEARVKITGATAATSDPTIPAGESRSFYSGGAAVDSTGGGGGGGGSPGTDTVLGIEEDGTAIPGARTLNFARGITATADSTDSTKVNVVVGSVPSGGAVTVKEDGTDLPGSISKLNFAAGLLAAVDGTDATQANISATGGSGGGGSASTTTLLLNQNFNITTAWQFLPTGLTLDATRHPWLLINTGVPIVPPSPPGTNSRLPQGQWQWIRTQEILGLPASTDNEAVTRIKGNALVVGVSGHEVDYLLGLGRTSANQLLITSSEINEDFYPFMVMGVSSVPSASTGGRGSLVATSAALQTTNWGTGRNNGVRFTLGPGATEYPHHIRLGGDAVGGPNFGSGIDYAAWTNSGADYTLLPDDVEGLIFVAKVGGVEKVSVFTPKDIPAETRTNANMYLPLNFTQTQKVYVHPHWFDAGGYAAVDLYGAGDTLPANSTIEVYWALGGGGAASGGGGGRSITVEEDGTEIGGISKLNFATGITAARDATDNTQANIVVTGGGTGGGAASEVSAVRGSLLAHTVTLPRSSGSWPSGPWQELGGIRPIFIADAGISDYGRVIVSSLGTHLFTYQYDADNTTPRPLPDFVLGYIFVAVINGVEGNNVQIPIRDETYQTRLQVDHSLRTGTTIGISFGTQATDGLKGIKLSTGWPTPSIPDPEWYPANLTLNVYWWLNGSNVRKVTQAEYDALAVKQSGVLYAIPETT